MSFTDEQAAILNAVGRVRLEAARLAPPPTAKELSHEYSTD